MSVCLYIYITFLYLHTLKSPSPGPGWKKSSHSWQAQAGSGQFGPHQPQRPVSSVWNPRYPSFYTTNWCTNLGNCSCTQHRQKTYTERAYDAYIIHMYKYMYLHEWLTKFYAYHANTKKGLVVHHTILTCCQGLACTAASKARGARLRRRAMDVQWTFTGRVTWSDKIGGKVSWKLGAWKRGI